MGVSKILMASLSHHRSLTCASAAYFPGRLVPHPPDLIKWVREVGGFVHQAVTIAQDGTNSGLGLVANQDIPKGSRLIAFPLSLTLQFEPWESANGAGVHPVLANLAQRIPEELWMMKLGLKLLQERATVGSFWQPYISNLPQTYTTLPIFFPEEDIKNLQYTPVIELVNMRCRFLLDFEQEVKRCLEDLKGNDHPFGGQDIDASSLGWAMSAASSRAFQLSCIKPDGTSYKLRMMTPLIGMVNHSFSPNIQLGHGQDHSTGEMFSELVAETPIKQNDALLLDYGRLNHDFSLLDYGFVVPSNPHDCIDLDMIYVEKKILSELNLRGEAPDLEVRIGGKDLVDGRLLAALRVLISNEIETVHEYDLDTLKSLSADAPLGVANEVAVFYTLIQLFSKIANACYPSSGSTTIVEDESLLKQGGSVSKLLAIQFRIQKKSAQIDAMMGLARRVQSLLSEDKTMSKGSLEIGAENEEEDARRRHMQSFCSGALELKRKMDSEMALRK